MAKLITRTPSIVTRYHRIETGCAAIMSSSNLKQEIKVTETRQRKDDGPITPVATSCSRTLRSRSSTSTTLLVRPAWTLSFLFSLLIFTFTFHPFSIFCLDGFVRLEW